MDIMSPDLMWIDGRCYRVPALDSTFCGVDIDKLKDCELEGEADDMIQYDDEVTDIPDVEVLQNGRFKIQFPVARAFLPFIIGSKGATVKRISKDTSCNIVIPKFSEEQKITIKGASKSKVILAWKSIALIVSSSRNKLAVTHFIGIPLTVKEIQENFKKFKEEVLLTCRDRGIKEDIFQLPEKLHLTIVVLILTDDKERKLAEEKLLEICNGQIRQIVNENKPCILEVRGLDIFNDDPSEVRVVYANVTIKNRKDLLQDICNKIWHAFNNTGLVKDEKQESVNIHLTLMNTSFLNRDSSLDSVSEHQGFKKSKKETFDATNIFKKYKDFYFGEQELKCIHLSTRFSADEDGFYKHTAMVEF